MSYSSGACVLPANYDVVQADYSLFATYGTN